MAKTMLTAKFLVIGGGIAGVTCAETLSAECPDENVILVAASPLIKAVTNYAKISRTMETFDVEEKPSAHVESECPNVCVVQAVVRSLDSTNKVVQMTDGQQIRYDKLCICTGGRPKLIPGQNSLVIGIRDTESVKDFQRKLSKATRIIIVGNGGIATELVYEVEGCEVVWAIRDRAISSTFVDAGAAQFFLPHLNEGKKEAVATVKRQKYTVEDDGSTVPQGEQTTPGGALGPDWAVSRQMAGSAVTCHRVHVEYCVEVKRVMYPKEVADTGLRSEEPSTFGGKLKQDWPVYVELTNGRVFGCDLVVSATGVSPHTEPFLLGNSFDVAEDGGLKVDTQLRTSVPDVFAAGDVCSASWELAELWLQMRLWTQARQMGYYAGRSMVAAVKGETISLDICFELFAHVTKFFGYKVVLLGLFNAHRLANDYELLLRVTPGEEYVKVVLHEGRLVGAVLIGETDLEETFENLALNRTDLTPFKDHLLDPAVDIDDFFD